jgi:hypothetical protein
MAMRVTANKILLSAIAGAGALVAFVPCPAAAVDITPHRAIYTMALDHAQPASGVVGADGRMSFEWADACSGWTVEQRYKLRIQYAEADESQMSVNFVTWESKDGKSYRFNVRKNHDDDPDEELKGTGAVAVSDKPGEAKFVKPDGSTFPLEAGTMFPTGHTIALIDAALGGRNFLAKPVFDGGTVEAPFQVTAAIGSLHPANAKDANPLLRYRWWPVRLAFFPSDSDSPQPDYELGMTLQENGIARDMTLDYGQFVIRAKLEKIEALAKPSC